MQEPPALKQVRQEVDRLKTQYLFLLMFLLLGAFGVGLILLEYEIIEKRSAYLIWHIKNLRGAMNMTL